MNVQQIAHHAAVCLKTESDPEWAWLMLMLHAELMNMFADLARHTRQRTRP
jgi:hypothetical protein